MARVRPNERGFSLVELLVALVFTMVLMAGMANVYKASLSTFYTSGEALSNLRRNRMSVDLLADDINAACMYLVDLTTPPTVSAASPPFYILPNMPITAPGPNDPTLSDELYFYVDQPLPFDGSMGGPAAPTERTAAEMVLAAGTAAQSATAADNTYVIDCGSLTYAKLVKKGQIFIFKDSWEAGYISADPAAPTDKMVTVLTGASPDTAITGLGPSGLPLNKKHLPGTGIVFMTPGQMIRYRIEIVKLDPGNANGIPCLVRDQGTYSLAGFTVNAAIPQQVISENVSGFKVYLSTNSGTAWAGLGAGYTGFDGGWDAGIRADLDTQLLASGRRDFTSTRVNEHWFRLIPTLVRVDVSTRTATQRAEYSAAGNALAYRNLTQTLVFVPRHSGLTLN
jgi:hypothetical protein